MELNIIIVIRYVSKLQNNNVIMNVHGVPRKKNALIQSLHKYKMKF